MAGKQLVSATVLLVSGFARLEPALVDSAPENSQRTSIMDSEDEPHAPFLSEGLDRRPLHDRLVLQAMERVPRHKFVPESVARKAYADRALPIGEGQTISQPFIVALMTQEAQIERGAKVLEIGTGSGYQAAVLAELGARVFSIEIVPELAVRAAKILAELGYQSVTVRQGDGWGGWPEEAPFAAILVTAATPRIPEALVSQLADHGRIVFPLEEPDVDGETLVVLERDGNELITTRLGGVKFVPLTGIARKDEPITGAGPEDLGRPAADTGDSKRRGDRRMRNKQRMP